MSTRTRQILVVFLGVFIAAYLLLNNFYYQPLDAEFLQKEGFNKLSFATTSPSKSLADGAEIIYLSTYGTEEKDGDMGVVDVLISRPKAKVLLFLYNQHHVRWTIANTAETNIVGIIASGVDKPPEIVARDNIQAYRFELPVSFEVENVAFKSVEVLLNHSFGLEKIDLYKGSYAMPRLIRISELKPVRFSPIAPTDFARYFPGRGR